MRHCLGWLLSCRRPWAGIEVSGTDYLRAPGRGEQIGGDGARASSGLVVTGWCNRVLALGHRGEDQNGETRKLWASLLTGVAAWRLRVVSLPLGVDVSRRAIAEPIMPVLPVSFEMLVHR